MHRALIPLLCALLVAMLAACQPVIDDREALQVPADLKIIGQRHCLHCGRIESKHEIAPKGADPLAPRVYEYKLRMRDGSSSVFRETLPAAWRVGERVGVIDGWDPALN
jgi:hypothetical protein